MRVLFWLVASGSWLLGAVDGVVINASTGKPQVTVPDLRGETATDAVGRLKDIKLDAKIIHVTSDQPTDQVIDQTPTAGASLAEGSTVRLKVSKGPQPIAVPNVVGDNVQVATSTLQGAGFAVAVKHVDSDQPKDSVISQNPGAGTSQPPGTTITLQVSKGPKTSAVPDVTSQTQDDATNTLNCDRSKQAGTARNTSRGLTMPPMALMLSA